MIEQEIAAIYYMVASIVDVKPYFTEVPDDFMIPSVFYPTPGMRSDYFSLSAYSTEFSMYARVYGADTLAAYELSSAIVHEIMSAECKIPLYDESRKKTGKFVRINLPKVKNIEKGIYQIEFTWRRYTSYSTEDVTKAVNFYLNGKQM